MKLSRSARPPALNFPNRSRSFDGARDRVCFWGYASAIEISFYVDTAVLRKFVPEMDATEAGILTAFDAGRSRIEEAAQNAHAHGDKTTYAYSLRAEDF